MHVHGFLPRVQSCLHMYNHVYVFVEFPCLGGRNCKLQWRTNLATSDLNVSIRIVMLLELTKPNMALGALKFAWKRDHKRIVLHIYVGVYIRPTWTSGNWHVRDKGMSQSCYALKLRT